MLWLRSGTRYLILGLGLHRLPYPWYTSSEAFDETVRLRMLVWAFPSRLGDQCQNRPTCLINVFPWKIGQWGRRLIRNITMTTRLLTHMYWTETTLIRRVYLNTAKTPKLRKDGASGIAITAERVIWKLSFLLLNKIHKWTVLLRRFV